MNMGMDFVLKAVSTFAQKHPWLTYSNLPFFVLYPLDDVLNPILTGMIVYRVQTGKPWGLLMILVIFNTIFIQLIYASSNVLDAAFIPRLQTHLREMMITDILDAKQGQAFAGQGDMLTGELMSRIIKIPLVATDFLERVKSWLIPYSISFVMTAAYIIYKDTTLGLVMLVCGITAIYIIITSPSMCDKKAAFTELVLAKLDEETEDIIRNIQVVHTSNTLSSELKHLEKWHTEYTKSYWITTLCSTKVRLLALTVLATSIIFFGFHMYRKVSRDKKHVALFVSVFVIIFQWFSTLAIMSSNIREMALEWSMLTSHQRTQKQRQKQELQHQQQHQQQQHLVPHRRANNDIILALINVSYKVNDVTILSGLTFDVKKGERVGLVGSVGSGKSTTLKLLAQVIKPTSGHILMADHNQYVPLQEFIQLQRHGYIGYVQQHSNLFNRSIYDNVTYGVPDADPAKVDELVESLGLKDAFENMSHGLNTKVGKNGSRLSGGQRQLVQMMRIMLLDPEILLLDEPTASLDNATREKMLKILYTLMPNKTVIMVTHDTELMKQANRLIRF